ncbi:MAG: SDR family oxidoreductase [Bacteroidales bacterium]|nr:SDR family oxidoreductase [Bacteroidales bacterium]
MKIVVSGASRGLGNALVKNLLSQGDEVFAFARSTENISKLTAQNTNKGKLYFMAFDLMEKDFSPLVKTIKEKLQTIDALVNNAGFLVPKPFIEMTDEDFNRMFDVNVKAPFKLIRELFPLFSKGSHILNISSAGGFQGSVKFPGLSLYSASKGALSILTESLAMEFAKEEIKVNALALGSAQTEMLAQAFPNYKAPLTADEMAEFIAYFTVNGHKFFNGKILPVSLSTP